MAFNLWDIYSLCRAEGFFQREICAVAQKTDELFSFSIIVMLPIPPDHTLDLTYDCGPVNAILLPFM